MDVQLSPVDEVDESSGYFGKHEEKAIISLAFDQPDFFSSILPYLKSEFFDQFATRFVFDNISYYYERNGVIITREMCKDKIYEDLTADDPHEEIVAVVDRKSDPREVPILVDKLMDWSKKKAMLQLYNKDVIEAVEAGEFDQVENIIENARKISDINNHCYFFFNEIDSLFQKEADEKFTTGFTTLDMAINNGGPGRGETFCWMAPTGVGKSIVMVNTAVANFKRGRNVLFISLEMPWKKVALRFMGCLTDVWIKDRFIKEEQVRSRLMSCKSTYNSNLVISEFPPDQVNVDQIQGQIDRIGKINGVKFDVVIIDYLELLMSRTPEYNRDDYIRQKRVGTEVDRLAKIEDVLVVTATQSNRSGVADSQKEKVLDLNQVAESYGKTMPISYLVTINQSKKEYEQGRMDPSKETSPVTKAQCRFFFAKNRNGAKNIKVGARVNYETMRMMEYDSLLSFNEDDSKKGSKKSDDGD